MPVENMSQVVQKGNELSKESSDDQETSRKHLLTESESNPVPAENISATSSWLPPPSSSKKSESESNPVPAENISATSSWLPPPSSSKKSENDESTTSLSLKSPVPPSTLSSQQHESEPESMSTSMTAGMENLNPQNDPGLWPTTITDVDRTEIVLEGPIRVKVDLFPVNDNGRRFSEYHYNKILVNGEKLDRRWMIYSQTKDAIYCFPCRIFGLENTKIGSSEGVCDWKHLGDYLKSHESSRQHKDSEIEEHFIGFLAVEKTTAESLTNYIIAELEQSGISLQNCRGQGYDNGANMRSEKSGVQKRILDINPLAYFLPCGSHSWNLILGDAASSCVQAKSFFGLLQRLYTLFAGSSQRWAISNAHVKSLSLKPLSETRWECRVASVKAVKYQLISDISDALKDLAENTTDCQSVSECHSIEKEITTYEFVVSLVIWYDILTKINVISKMWQSENMHLDVAIQHLDAFTNWLDNYRENGFQSSLVTAREIAEENDIDRQFRRIHKLAR
ncbi:hypothetical protein QE152_g26647 [Popillia japonica]|uniref:TTF-type domain-containing protein n=1 Tax=Popillia japonica TaxID=7064 RepID=A0AAW1JW83_POPJA